MQLVFLGTGTSMGIPIIGCRCPVCTSPDPRNRRMRTSALVRVDGLQLLIDAGPDFRSQALTAAIDHIDAVLLTHSHFDHVGGLDDLRPLNFRGGAIPLYGNRQTLADIRQRYAYAFEAASAGSTKPMLELCEVSAPFTIGATAITPVEIMHGSWPIIAYRIGQLAYVTDASIIPPPSLALLRGCRVLVLNALRDEPHPTHFSLDEALAVVDELAPERTFLVHMTHSLDHSTVNARLPAGVELAYDGLVVEVD